MLKVYSNNVVEWYIAESPSDAALLCKETSKVWGISDEELDLDFVECDPGKYLSMYLYNEDTKKEDLLQLFPSQWAEKMGRGLLGTTEY